MFIGDSPLSVIQAEFEQPSTSAKTVTSITETHVTLDGNHPLAGKELIFEIELVEVV